MRTGFITSKDDIRWLKEVHLAGLELGAFAGFKFAVLMGNEDAPYAVKLYMSYDPAYSDDYLYVVFPSDTTPETTVCLMDGMTDKPYTVRERS